MECVQGKQKRMDLLKLPVTEMRKPGIRNGLKKSQDLCFSCS